MRKSTLLPKPKQTLAIQAPSPGAAPRPKRNAEQTREALLQAALAEFAREGYGGGRVDRISRAASSNDRMLYYYFESKEKLFRAVIERCYADLVRAQEALELDLSSPRDALAALIAFNWNYYWQHPELLSLLASENLFEGRHVRDAIKADFSHAQFNMLERVIGSGITAKQFRPDTDLFLVFMTILSLTYFYRANLHTLTTYLGTDLNDMARREMWLAHVQTIVADLVAAPKTRARQATSAKSARR
jgi:AcrR family transcriptional regulator